MNTAEFFTHEEPLELQMNRIRFAIGSDPSRSQEYQRSVAEYLSITAKRAAVSDGCADRICPGCQRVLSKVEFVEGHQCF